MPAMLIALSCRRPWQQDAEKFFGDMASITAKKNQAKLAEGIYKQTHCKYDINCTI